MKKPLFIILAACFTLSLHACSDDGNDTPSDDATDDTIGADTVDSVDDSSESDTSTDSADTSEPSDVIDTEDGTTVVEDDICTGTPSCSGIQNLGVNVPQICGSTEGCTWNQVEQECQGIPAFTGCGDVDNQDTCEEFNCTWANDGESGGACQTPEGGNPELDCEYLTDPNGRELCTLYGCTYTGPTTGTCSEPNQGYDVNCDSLRIGVEAACSNSDPQCCEYYMQSGRDWCEVAIPVRTSKQIIIGPQEFCTGNPESPCSDFSAANCPTAEGCAIDQEELTNRDICVGSTVEITCSMLTGERDGTEGQFGDTCEAFGCNWAWDSAE